MSSYSDDTAIIDSFDWNQLSLERLKLLKAKINQAIDLKREELYLTNPTTNNTLVSGYRASLSKVSPARLRSSLSEYQQCIFGISLGSKNFVERERLEACIKWISENFNTCLVLVTDSIYRLTIEVRQEARGDAALLEALRTGEQYIKDNYSLFEQYSGSCQFKFQKASEIQQQSEFDRYYQELQIFYKKNESFQSLVNLFAQKYLSRVQPMATNPREHIGITYLLEESALNACLAQQGWLVVVYPGSIKTFEDISEGLHPEAPLPLQQMIWVSLRLKKWTFRC